MKESVEFIEVIGELIENSRNKNQKQYLLEILDNALQSVSWNGNETFTEEINKLKNNKILKWIRSEELSGITLKLYSTCLSHGPKHDFHEELENFISKKSFKKIWKNQSKKEYYLKSILQLITGEYKGSFRFQGIWQPVTISEYEFIGSTSNTSIKNTLNDDNTPTNHTENHSSIHNEANTVTLIPKWTNKHSYYFTPLLDNELLLQARLKLIFNCLFFKKSLKAPIDQQMIDTTVHILLQIGLHDFNYLKSTIIPYLFNDKSNINVNKLIGFKLLLNIIESPEYLHFCQFHVNDLICKNDVKVLLHHYLEDIYDHCFKLVVSSSQSSFYQQQQNSQQRSYPSYDEYINQLKLNHQFPFVQQSSPFFPPSSSVSGSNFDFFKTSPHSQDIWDTGMNRGEEDGEEHDLDDADGEHSSLHNSLDCYDADKKLDSKKMQKETKTKKKLKKGVDKLTKKVNKKMKVKSPREKTLKDKLKNKKNKSATKSNTANLSQTAQRDESSSSHAADYTPSFLREATSRNKKKKETPSFKTQSEVPNDGNTLFVNDFHQIKVSESLDRFYEFIFSPEVFEHKLNEMEKYSTRRLQDAIASYCKNQMVPSFSSINSFQFTSIEEKQSDNPKVNQLNNPKVMEYKDRIPVEVMSVMIKSIKYLSSFQFLLGKSTNQQTASSSSSSSSSSSNSLIDKFFGQFIIHPDQQLSDITIRILIDLIREYPEERELIIELYCKFITSKSNELSSNSIEVLLYNLLFLSNYWCYLLQIQIYHLSNNKLDGFLHTTPDHSFLTQLPPPSGSSKSTSGKSSKIKSPHSSSTSSTTKSSKKTKSSAGTPTMPILDQLNLDKMTKEENKRTTKKAINTDTLKDQLKASRQGEPTILSPKQHSTAKDTSKSKKSEANRSDMSGSQVNAIVFASKGLLIIIERLALIQFCHHSAKIRYLALKLIDSFFSLLNIHNINDSYTSSIPSHFYSSVPSGYSAENEDDSLQVNGRDDKDLLRNRLSYVLYEYGQDIIERARYRYLLSIYHGIINHQDEFYELNTFSPIPSIELILLSNDYLFWNITLTEILFVLTDKVVSTSSSQSIASLLMVNTGLSTNNFSIEYLLKSTREILYKRIQQLQNTSLIPLLSSVKSNYDDCFNYFNELSCKRFFYHSFLFASSNYHPTNVTSTHSITHSSSSSSVNDDLVLNQFFNYLVSTPNGYWINLVSESEQINDEIYFATASIHHSSIQRILSLLWSFYSDSNKKIKLKIRGNLIKLLNKITQSLAFQKIMKMGDINSSSMIIAALDDFIQNIDQINSIKFVSIHSPMLHFIQIISNFTNAILKTNQNCLYTSDGPLRVNLISSVAPGLLSTWPIESRQQLFTILNQYYNNYLTSVEVSKLLSSIKDNSKKKEKQMEIEYIQYIIYQTFTNLSNIGTLFNEQNIPYEAYHWASKIEQEKKYNFHPLRGLLSFHFKRSISIYIDNTYMVNDQTEQEDSYLHAIFDQFIEPTTINGYPKSHITQLHINYASNLARNPQLVEKRQGLPLSKPDEKFSKTIQSHSGALIFFLFFNLLHPDIIIRKRCFQVIKRLVPVHFGKYNSVPSSRLTLEIQNYLKQFESAFNSYIYADIVSAAHSVAKITSFYCKTYTQSVFKEAFFRFLFFFLNFFLFFTSLLHD